jgi:hypothetical protein
MKEPPNSETHVSILAPPDGTALIFQGYRKPALFLRRENISRFITDPHSTGMLAIPPFAALALQCFVAADSVKTIQLKQDLAIDEHYALTVRLTTGSGVRFVSSHENLDSAQALARESVRIVVTPKMVAMLDDFGATPRLNCVAEIPHEERADYARRFVLETSFLVQALERAIASKTHTLLL